MAAKDTGIPSDISATAPSTNAEEEEDNRIHSVRNIGNIIVEKQRSAFSSPQLNNNNNINNANDNHQQQQQQPHLPNVPSQNTISTGSGGGGNGGGEALLHPGSAHATPTPLLNGENIVLLSFSNDTTPAHTPPVLGLNTNNTNSNITFPNTIAHTTTSLAMAAILGNDNDDDDDDDDRGGHDNFIEEEEELNDMTLSPSSFVANANNNTFVESTNAFQQHSSPPPESVHSGVLTTLSPPPLSLKTYDDNDHLGEQASHSGSQSLFSRENTNVVRGQISSNANANNQPSTVASAGGNTAPSKKRPPLPPRWAIGNAGVASSHHAGMAAMLAPLAPPAGAAPPSGVGGGDMVDVVPNHLPPPKQIGPLSHRRVLSTGDASFLSNLTDPDSIPDVGEDNNSPPMGGVVIPERSIGVGFGGGGAGAAAAALPSGIAKPLPLNPQQPSGRKRGVSWDFGAQAVGTAAALATSHSESDGSVNRYKNEEEAAFDTLGILQPILQEDDHNIIMHNVGIGGNNAVVGSELLGGDDPMSLMQPILLDDEKEEEERNHGIMGESMLGGTSSAFTSSNPVVVVNPSAVIPPRTIPPPPPPPPLPEKVVRKQKSDKSLSPNRAPSSKNVNRGAPPKLAKMATKKDLTQFEDEAELAILEALSAYNMQSTKEGASIAANIKQHQGLSLSPVHDNDENEDDDDDDEDDDDDDDDDESSEGQGYIMPTHVPHPTHRNELSALTTLGFDPSSPNISMHSRKKGDNILLEDSAWTEDYDVAGRIDGTLPEEQDAKLVGDQGLLGSVADPYLNPRVAVAASSAGGSAARPPNHPLLSVKNQTSQRTNISKRTVKQEEMKQEEEEEEEEDDESVDVATKVKMKLDDAKAKLDDFTKNLKIETAPPKDPTAATGMRHRKNKTIAAKGMADELALLAQQGDSNHSGFHQRNKTAQGGIDNLLDGVNIMAEREEKKLEEQRGKAAAASGHGDEEPNDGSDSGDNAPHDEETGDVSNHAKNDKKNDDKSRPHGGRFSRRSEKSSSLGRRSEMLYNLRLWYQDLIKPKIPAFIKGATHSILFIMVPLLTVAFILFYGIGNPLVGASERVDEAIGATEPASWSWWAVFFVRQFYLLCCVKAGEVISIDILALRTPIFLKVFGTFATLMIVQARGWPYVLTFWSIMDFCFLFGNHAFSLHWLFWQDWIDLFNAKNPAGNFLSSEIYMRILLAMMFVGVATSLKRLWIATFLGRRSYAHYGPELEVILAKMLLVSQIAHLARQIDSQVIISRISDGYAFGMREASKSIHFPGLTTDSEDESPTLKSRKSLDEISKSGGSKDHLGNHIETPENGFGQSLLSAGIGRKMVAGLSKARLDASNKLASSKNVLRSSSTRDLIFALLEEWEEPAIKANAKSKASIKDVLQFRQAVSLMSDEFPFTPAFGPAKSRAQCVESSEKIFETLRQRTVNNANTANTTPLLPFETLSEIAYDANDVLVREKVKALIRLFRPDRKGFLTKLDFVGSIDEVYKDLRLFRASLANSSSIDDSFETIINALYYTLMVFLILLIVGFKLWEPILSFSAFFFSFSFMFGPASSKYFEGILLIFVRRPYDIGDKIALSDPENDTSASGSSTWFVEKVSLFATTCRFATTNEVATYSNGSLARLRIINAKRSPKAIIYVYMKFGSDVPYQMIKVYQTAIENFVKSRPREWSQLNGFRATRVEMELNYIEYVIVATHREMWQNAGPILQSQADLASYSLEVSKKLNLRYHNPPKPIHLSMSNENKSNETKVDSGGLSQFERVERFFGVGGGVADVAGPSD